MPAKTAGRGHVRKGAKKEIIGAKEMVGPTGDVPVANSMLTACVMPQAFWAVIWTMVREAFVLRCSRGAARVSMRGKPRFKLLLLSHVMHFSWDDSTFSSVREPPASHS